MRHEYPLFIKDNKLKQLLHKLLKFNLLYLNCELKSNMLYLHP